MRRSVIVLGLVVSACTEFPGVDAALSDGTVASEPPELLPFEELLDTSEPQLSETEDEVLLARADALRTRAKDLRRPVIDGATRERMNDGVDTP